MTISKEKTEKKNHRKRKETHFQSQILPTYHSSIHEGFKTFNKRTYRQIERGLRYAVIFIH
jgi:hypothetical protein